ncbi:histidine kinase [Flavobacteriaceae bacterium CRH]|nr:histidine kinase [Flavobacteriaceae bacterium CRH]
MDQKIILLADDDSDDTEMFCEALENIDKNIICHCSINGSELLKKLSEMNEKPNLIFLDLNMPIMNGWQCLNILKEDERYHDIPVIMISTSSHTKEMSKAIDLGAICYLVKPNNFNELMQVLHEITTNLETDLKNTIINLQKNGSGNVFGYNDNNSKQ